MNDTNRRPRIVGNVVDLEKFRLPGPLDAGPLRVVMISSNLHTYIDHFPASAIAETLEAVYKKLI